MSLAHLVQGWDRSHDFVVVAQETDDLPVHRRQSIRKSPFSADKIAETLVPLSKILEKTLGGDVIFGFKTCDGFVSVPEVNLAEKRVAETGDSTCATKVSGWEKRSQLIETEVIVGARALTHIFCYRSPVVASL